MNGLSVWAKDAWERVWTTYVEAFLAVFVGSLVGTTFFEDLAAFDLNEKLLGSAAAAGLAAVAALVKANLAKRVNGTVSPASLASDE